MILFIRDGQNGQGVEKSADKYGDGVVLIQQDVVEQFWRKPGLVIEEGAAKVNSGVQIEKIDRREIKEKEKETSFEVKLGNGNTLSERKNCRKNRSYECVKIKHFIQIGQNGQSVVISVRRPDIKSAISKHYVA